MHKDGIAGTHLSLGIYAVEIRQDVQVLSPARAGKRKNPPDMTAFLASRRQPGENGLATTALGATAGTLAGLLREMAHPALDLHHLDGVQLTVGSENFRGAPEVHFGLLHPSFRDGVGRRLLLQMSGLRPGRDQRP